jgi:hypothetical protein
VAEWLKAADCKSAHASVRWFESSPFHQHVVPDGPTGPDSPGKARFSGLRLVPSGPRRIGCSADVQGGTSGAPDFGRGGTLWAQLFAMQSAFLIARSRQTRGSATVAVHVRPASFASPMTFEDGMNDATIIVSS